MLLYFRSAPTCSRVSKSALTRAQETGRGCNMKRVSLYSRSTPVRPIVARAEARTESAVPESTAAPANGRTRIGPFLRRWKSPLLVVAGAAFAIILVYTHGAM